MVGMGMAGAGDDSGEAIEVEPPRCTLESESDGGGKTFDMLELSNDSAWSLTTLSRVVLFCADGLTFLFLGAGSFSYGLKCH